MQANEIMKHSALVAVVVTTQLCGCVHRPTQVSVSQRVSSERQEALARAAATAILGRHDGTQACIVNARSADESRAGRAFIRELETAASALEPTTATAPLLSFELISVSPGDTATVFVRVSGDTGLRGTQFWNETVQLRFVAVETAVQWRFLARQSVAREHYVSEGPRTSTPPCLNHRRPS